LHAHLIHNRQTFEGHSGVIQRNALKSWKLLHPDIEIILFGDDAGSAEIANELGFRHEPFVERNEFGTERLDYIFHRAQELAKHDFVCYCNCDIILLPEFCVALKRIADAHAQFLMVGVAGILTSPRRLISTCPTGRALPRLSRESTASSSRVTPLIISLFDGAFTDSFHHS
jgi:hypothetical protein